MPPIEGAAPLSKAAALRLKPPLDLYLESVQREGWTEARIGSDPIELPRRYTDPRDIEVAGLLSALMAYGRVELFKPKVEGLLGKMGASPASFVHSLDARRAHRLLEGFVYRFNVGTDLAVLLLGMGQALRRQGSLEALFVQQRVRHSDYREALAGFGGALRDVPIAPLRRLLGPERGLDHLLPAKPGTGAAKRLNLFLRWMVRGPDRVDFGTWKRVSASELRIPLDTHIARLSTYLGLTRRADMGWKTAEEITASLRLLDPADPVKYDFVLCHHGMSGLCPPLPMVVDCRRCALATGCRLGRRRLT